MKKPLLFARELIGHTLKEGDTAIDATCGNGHDTLFLAEWVGETGSVLAFDIQQEALHNTKERLSEVGLAHRVTFIHASHTDLSTYLNGPITAVMFNLGYLPGGDHQIKTDAQSTVLALGASVSALKIGGMITIMAYTGHPGGMEEYSAVYEYLLALPQQEFNVLTYQYINQKNNPPVLLAVSRL
ncbi:MAG: methyltransferase domain-containing protein [Clostridiales bacterium]|jgi:predicted methyltransferase|nr:methyltransferase domain-containing protein [Clostridiales bacterium]